MILVRAGQAVQLAVRCAVAAETVVAARSGVGAIDDDRPGDGPSILVLSARRPIRAQVSPPRGVLPAQGMVVLFSENERSSLVRPI